MHLGRHGGRRVGGGWEQEAPQGRNQSWTRGAAVAARCETEDGGVQDGVAGRGPELLRALSGDAEADGPP